VVDITVFFSFTH